MNNFLMFQTASRSRSRLAEVLHDLLDADVGPSQEAEEPEDDDEAVADEPQVPEPFVRPECKKSRCFIRKFMPTLVQMQI